MNTPPLEDRIDAFTQVVNTIRDCDSVSQERILCAVAVFLGLKVHVAEEEEEADDQAER